MASSESSKPAPAADRPPPRGFLAHLEAYLARRDGVDKLLKISCYAARLLLAAGPPLPPPASARLRSFESSVALSRKAFRVGKFLHSLNVLRAHYPHPPPALALLAHGGEGVHHLAEQLAWLAEAGGLLHARLLLVLQRLGAWADLLGLAGSVAIKLGEAAEIESSIKKLLAEGCDCEEEQREAVRTMQGELLLKRASVAQVVADAVVPLRDVTGGKGLLGSSTLMAAAGLLSALISMCKNWKCC
ncbi:hypothetical protein U9M48_007149 [Paspalum notatum var. saurae]|uniref:Uncharacterized protein n=1 Tax=Paspalum notatum var. saurae TaxID=547442 RepID=A0AAQ3PQV6_PASNO